jgi:putative ABC transport system permease protein
MTKTILRCALRLCPRSFRKEFGPEIEADFEEGIGDARGRGRISAFRFAIAGAWNIATSGLAERLERRRSFAPAGARRSRRESLMRGTIGQDLKLACRGLRGSPAFTAVAVIALALGIGANSAIFSVVNAVLLRPLPYDRSEELVRIWSSWTQFPRGGVSEPEYYDYRSVDSIESVGAFIFPHDATLAVEGGEPEPVKRTFVTASLFRALGARALHGRTFDEEENEPGKGDVVVLSHGLWRREFGSDPGILGRTLRIQAKAVTVVGVMPEWFQYPQTGVDLWLPLTLNPERPRPRAAHFMRVVARLKDGASLDSARTELAVVGARMEQEFRESYPEGAGFGVLVLPLGDDLVAEVRPALLILLGAVGFVLLIACANVANLLLARAAARERELAVRKALGASRWSVVRQLLTESVLLSVLSGAVSLLLAHWILQGLVALAPGEIPRLDAVAIDIRVLAFTFVVSVGTGVAFGTFPAWRLSRTSAGSVLGAGGRRTMGVDRRRTQKALLASEVALAVALLVGAGLLLRSFHNLVQVDPGFDAAPLATARLSLPLESYPDDAACSQFLNALRRNLEGLSGVAAAAFVSNAPFSGFNSDYTFYVEGMDSASYSGSEEYREISPGYFRTIGIPLVAGREFDLHDDADAPPVAVVSESFARKYWNGEDPVGRRLKMGERNGDAPWVTVVGVVGDVRHAGLAAPTLPMYYRPSLRRSEEMTLLVRARTDPGPLLASIREEVRRLDSDLAVFGVETMDRKVAASIASPRFNLTLLAAFALFALLLAAVGVYGLARYAATLRTGEIGLRVALGATRHEILRLVVGEGIRTAGLGLALGLVASAALSRGLAAVPGLLHGVSATDLPTYAGVAILLSAVVLLATFGPASKASRTAPVEALRHE